MEEGKKNPKDSVRGVRLAQDRSRETLQRILDAAQESFAENGYQSTSVAEIISRAGIGHGTFWLYFHNKDDLLKFMVRGMIEEFEALAWYGENNLEKFPVRSLPEVKEILRGVMEIFERYTDIHPFIVQASLESEEFQATLEELNQPFVRILERKLREHLEKDYCRDFDPGITARIIVTMLEYANLQWVNNNLPTDRETLVHNLSVIIFHTLNH